MFCVHCGKEIDNDSRFCPYCGGEQPPAPQAGPSVGDFLGNAGQSLGNEIDNAINEVKNSDEARVIKETVSEAGKKAEDIKKNWRDYLTLENMELAAPVLLLMPLIMGIIKMVLFRVLGIFLFIPVIGVVFKVIFGLVKLIFVIAAGAGLGAVGYILYKKPEKRTPFGFVALGASVLSFVSCLGMFFNWKYVTVIFGLLSLAWGLESIARVVLGKKGMESQPDVQADIDAYKSFYAEMKDKYNREKEKDRAAMPQGTDANGNAVPAVMSQNNSYFDGEGTELLGLLVLTAILGSVTCGIATPWMLCKVFKWRKTHTVIDGRRLDFNGNGESLLGHWILWEILTVVTCGIYSFFLVVALRKWEMQHTFYADDPTSVGSFDGNSFQFFGYGLLQTLLIVLTCSIATPWTITMIEKWQMKHSIVGADRMYYDGTGLGLFGQYIICGILSTITCGIYTPWAIVRLDKYLFSHVHVDHGYEY